jgi:superfamily II DNA or RNA helicase
MSIVLIERARTYTRLRDAVEGMIRPTPPTTPHLKAARAALDTDATRYLRLRLSGIRDDEAMAGPDGDYADESDTMPLETLASQNFELLTGEMAGGVRKNKVGNLLEQAYHRANELGKPVYIFAKSAPTAQIHKGLDYRLTDEFTDWQKYAYHGEYMGYEVFPRGMVRKLTTKPNVEQLSRMDNSDTRISLDIFRSYNQLEAFHLAALPELIETTAGELHSLGDEGRALAFEVQSFLEDSDGMIIHPSMARSGGISDRDLARAKKEMDRDNLDNPDAHCEDLLRGTLPPEALKERKLAVLEVMNNYVMNLGSLPAAINGFGQNYFKLPVSDATFRKICLHMRFAVPFGARLKYALSYLTRVRSGQPAFWKRPLMDALDRLIKEERAKPSIFKPQHSEDILSMYLGEWESLTHQRMQDVEVSLIWDAYKGNGDAQIGALPENMEVNQWTRELNNRIIPVMEKNEPNYRELRRYLESKELSYAYDLEIFKKRYERGDDAGNESGIVSGDGGGDFDFGDGGTTSLSKREILGRADVEKRYRDAGVALTRREISGITKTQHLSELYARTLKTHQNDGCNLILEAHQKSKGFVLADGTGAGKTMQELAVALHYSDMGKMVLVVTKDKKVIQGAFRGDFQRFETNQERLEHLPDAAQPFDSNNIYITTYNRLHEARQHQWDIVIFDEAHAAKNLINSNPSAQAQYVVELMDKAEKVVCATATPADKGYQMAYLCRMWGIDPYMMVQRMGLEFDPTFGWQSGEGLDKESQAGIEANIMQDFMREATKKGLMVKREVSMANLDYINQQIELSPDWRAMYEALNRHYQQLWQMAKGIAKGTIKGQWMLNVRRLLDIAKAEAAGFAALDELKAGRKVVVFSCAVEDTQDIAEQIQSERAAMYEMTDEEIDESINKLRGKATTGRVSDMIQQAGYRVFEMTGKRTDKQRNAAVAQFQAGELDAIVTTFDSGGTGINLDDTVGDSPRSVVITQPPFGANDVIQGLGRVNRLTTKSRAKAIQLMTNLAIDDWNQSLVATKLQRLGGAVGGDYGKIDLNKIADLDNGEIQKYLRESGVPSRRPIPVGSDEDEPDVGDAGDRELPPEWFTIPEDLADAVDQLEMKAPFELIRDEAYPYLVDATFYSIGALPNPILKYGPDRGSLMFDNFERGCYIASKTLNKTMEEISHRIRNGSFVVVPAPAEIPDLVEYYLVKCEKKDRELVQSHGGVYDADSKLWKVPVERWPNLDDEARSKNVVILQVKQISEGIQRHQKAVRNAEFIPVIDLGGYQGY